MPHRHCFSLTFSYLGPTQIVMPKHLGLVTPLKDVNLPQSKNRFFDTTAHLKEQK